MALFVIAFSFSPPHHNSERAKPVSADQIFPKGVKNLTLELTGEITNTPPPKR
jgi:hypothetical protein